MPSSSRHRQVIVVGAGAAGVGVGVALQEIGLEPLLIDRHGVGASFERWPREMRFITPSFPTNSAAMLDLNAVALGTSPGYSLRCEHPTGREYAAYLQGVARHFRLAMRTGIDVRSVERSADGFLLQTTSGTWTADFVVWAAGEFQYPQRLPFVGGELCRHNAEIAHWGQIRHREVIVIGGYESGVDAACHLVNLGKRVRLLERGEADSDNESDPSRTLSPFTWERLAAAQRTGRLERIDHAEVVRVHRGRLRYLVSLRDGRQLRTAGPPVLATGFSGSWRLVGDLFEEREDGFPLLSESDESTLTPGLFLCGPGVRHDRHVFCFIYKFRQRFAVVASAIGERLGVDVTPLESYRAVGMFLDDLSCCGQACVC